MTTTTATEPANWNLLQKMIFRFLFVFFILFILFNPNAVSLPGVTWVYNSYIDHFHNLIAWLAQHLLHLSKPITIFTNGSGDTTYDYLTVLFISVVAAISMLIWSFTGRNTKHYNKLFYWLCVIVRFYVAINMIAYGYSKIIKLQFPAPSPARLLQPIGDMSPMGLAWTYMGYSTGFNYFTGFAEALCGILLMFRRTTTLGAIIGVAVAGNIMAINYCFDVPVKILSTMLVTMCIFLLFRDYTRLVNFFIKNKPAPSSNLSAHRFKARWKNITLNVLKYAIVAYVVIGYLISSIASGTMYGDDAKKPQFYGAYKVLSFVRNADTIPPLTTDSTRWSNFIIPYTDGAQIKFMNDSTKYLSCVPDKKIKAFVINTYDDPAHKYTLYYQSTKDTLLLSGKWGKDNVHIVLKKYGKNNFRLINRGFHWINEYPYNN
jgi:hypothetical protein